MVKVIAARQYGASREIKKYVPSGAFVFSIALDFVNYADAKVFLISPLIMIR